MTAYQERIKTIFGDEAIVILENIRKFIKDRYGYNSYYFVRQSNEEKEKFYTCLVYLVKYKNSIRGHENIYYHERYYDYVTRCYNIREQIRNYFPTYFSIYVDYNYFL